ncbi:M23 family metallopeptidase [Oceanobacillus bengalensis]|uniref:M23 family metallopeptidase n=1 Tax=Oceanobacillus bengalensis TaxID=1435466 RepID=A0A494YYS5_9BACI|nr:M23 family metallopeptidase [Oceanobacillus bengalensis]RKQ15344.1 M23 family metallopeptidase [Oceanobacillus bengalensis]
MNEENKGTPKNKWSRIFRKKWFFPALYLSIAALLLAGVVWYQNLDNQAQDATEQTEDEQLAEDYVPTPNDEDAEPVLEQQETIQLPVTDLDQSEIVTKFYDYNASQEDQEAALVFYNNRYYQSTGVDIASANDETFDVVASLSGTVQEVKEDPLLGNVVTLTHPNEVMTHYASLGEVTVTAGDDVKQGDKLGTAGKNIFGKDNGTHVHFEIRKDGKEVNPESYFNQPVSNLDNELGEEVSEDSEQAEDQESEANEAAESTESEEAEQTETESEEAEQTETEESEEEAPGEDDSVVDDSEDEDVDSEDEN